MPYSSRKIKKELTNYLWAKYYDPTREQENPDYHFRNSSRKRLSMHVEEFIKAAKKKGVWSHAEFANYTPDVYSTTAYWVTQICREFKINIDFSSTTQDKLEKTPVYKMEKDVTDRYLELMNIEPEVIKVKGDYNDKVYSC